jgi:hypothetical protein
MVHTYNLSKGWTTISTKTDIFSIGGGPAIIKERENIFPKEIYLVLNEDGVFENAFYFEKDKRKTLSTTQVDNAFWINLDKLSIESGELVYQGDLAEYVMKENINPRLKIFVRCLIV